jgi:uncharacterized protein YhjY with autotransporter beta-barrel domain
MKKNKVFSRNKVSLAISLAVASASTYALDTRLTYNQQGVPVFETRFFDVGDGPYMKDGEGKTQYSMWNLSAEQKDKMQKGIEYWARAIQPPAGSAIAVINVGTNKEENASATSEGTLVTATTAITDAQAALTGRNALITTLNYESHAQFQMGSGLTYDSIAYVPSQQPRAPSGMDIAATALHELAHGLGVMGSIADKNGKGTPYFGRVLYSWDQHLRDDNGNPAAPNQVVLCNNCKNTDVPTGFDLNDDKGYFTGEHVNEVLAGAMPGVPVRMNSADGTIDDNYLSHIELKNSLMSHQTYRNYTTFMEAELAVMQDLGYQIDRRNLFGYSVYGDGQTLYNQHGYFQRNAAGTDYLVGASNTTPLGVGLHIYGSNNRIYQQADLLTRGDGAAGVRVDGEGNTLVVQPGTRIHADGLNGRGVLFAYGKDHNFIQRGDIQALGEQGVAVEFNFGSNLLGNEDESRGSYIHTKDGKTAELLPELEGALVDNVDISGRLAGKAAAISISANALVNNINVLSGAKLEGNILSAYDQEDDNGNQRLTQLTFGRLADSQGRATDKADSNFRMTYNGDIQGINNLALSLRGGETSLGGKHQLYSMEVAPGAALSGNGQFNLNRESQFVNRGTIAPSDSNGTPGTFGTITVNGHYQQSKTGQLLVDVNGKGAHDTLKVKGTATLAGQLTVAPQRGWYSPTWMMQSSQLLQSTSKNGAFDKVELLSASPTLSLLTTPQANGNYLLSFGRASNAYSQYAISQNGRSVGEALSRTVTSSPSADRQKLYTTLDFSNPDGSTIATALEQLSPSAYSAMMASSLQREQQVADAISAREPGKLRDDEWQAFIQPFGGNSRQNTENDMVGYTTNSYGVIFGAETAASSDGALIVGLHGAASKQNLSLKDPQHGDGDTSALELGVHARYALDPMAGTYWLGSARVGYESGELKRKLNFDDYSAQNKADWTGKSASVVGGGGYRFPLNENVSMGPIATLTYTSLWRDGTHEKGADGSALKLKSQQFDSLRSSVGLNSAMKFPLEGGRAIKAEGQVTWNHELLNTDLIQDATFANYQGSSFRSKNTVMDRDSMGLRGSVRYSLSENVDVGAGVASDLFRTGYNSVSGNLSLDWRF